MLLIFLISLLYIYLRMMKMTNVNEMVIYYML